MSHSYSYRNPEPYTLRLEAKLWLRVEPHSQHIAMVYFTTSETSKQPIPCPARYTISYIRDDGKEIIRRLECDELPITWTSHYIIRRDGNILVTFRNEMRQSVEYFGPAIDDSETERGSDSSDDSIEKHVKRYDLP